MDRVYWIRKRRSTDIEALKMWNGLFGSWMGERGGENCPCLQNSFRRVELLTDFDWLTLNQSSLSYTESAHLTSIYLSLSEGCSLVDPIFEYPTNKRCTHEERIGWISLPAVRHHSDFFKWALSLLSAQNIFQYMGKVPKQRCMSLDGCWKHLKKDNFREKKKKLPLETLTKDTTQFSGAKKYQLSFESLPLISVAHKCDSLQTLLTSSPFLFDWTNFPSA